MTVCEKQTTVHAGLIFRSTRAFTLLEVMISLSIISIVLISIYRMHSQTIAMNEMSRFNATAPFLAQRKMVEIQTSPGDASLSDSGTFEDSAPGYRWQTAISEIESTKWSKAARHLKKIDVTVSRNENEYSYRLTTYWNFPD